VDYNVTEFKNLAHLPSIAQSAFFAPMNQINDRTRLLQQSTVDTTENFLNNYFEEPSESAGKCLEVIELLLGQRLIVHYRIKRSFHPVLEINLRSREKIIYHPKIKLNYPNTENLGP
jgi:hypothetical protein